MYVNRACAEVDTSKHVIYRNVSYIHINLSSNQGLDTFDYLADCDK